MLFTFFSFAQKVVSSLIIQMELNKQLDQLLKAYSSLSKQNRQQKDKLLLMGACTGGNRKQDQIGSPFKKKSSSKDEGSAKQKMQAKLLSLIYDDLAERSPNGQMTAESFQSFLHLNKVCGSSMLGKFSTQLSQTLKKSLFVSKIQKIFKLSQQNQIKQLFSFYDIDGNKGISYREILALLIGFPIQMKRQLISSQDFLNFLSVQDIAYILSENKNLKKLVPELSIKRDALKRSHTNLNKATGQIELMLVKEEGTTKISFESEQTQSAQIHQLCSLVRAELIQNIKTLNCTTLLMERFAQFIFHTLKLNKEKDQINLEQFVELNKKFPLLLSQFLNAFHPYLWRCKDSLQPFYSTVKSIAFTKCKLIDHEGNQHKIFVKFIGRSWLLFEDKICENLWKIINLEGLNVSIIQQDNDYILQLSHQNKVYPIKKFVFPDKEVGEEWYRLSVQFHDSNFYQSYKLHELIDKGSFGEVYRCESVEKNQFFAVKIINKFLLEEASRLALRSQMEMLEVCSQFDVVKLIQKFENKKKMFIVTELLNQGTLYDYVHKKKSKCLSEQQTRRIMKRLLKTVSNLHKIGIIHRDLKANNIMMKINDKEALPIIIDFGLAVYKFNLNRQCLERKFVGSANFVPPEIYNQQPYDEKVDVFSLGVNMYFMLSGYLPFQSFDPSIIRESICDCEVKFIHTKWKKVSEDAKRLILKMICFKKDRISCEEALASKWFTDEKQEIKNSKQL